MSRETVVNVVRESLVLGGAAAVSVGVGMIYLPAGIIVAGVLMLAAGIAGVLR